MEKGWNGRLFVGVGNTLYVFLLEELHHLRRIVQWSQGVLDLLSL
jgi:hypothetical protein